MQWQDIPEFPQYRVSDSGEILSYCRGKPRLLKVRLTQRKAVVSLRLNGKEYYFRVGPLVLTVFVGPRPLGMDCCHWDGNPMNNRVSNLRWDTRQGNVADSIRHGKVAVGSRNGQSKLTESDIVSILRQASEGVAIRKLARIYNVAQATMRAVVRRKSWRHVQ